MYNQIPPYSYNNDVTSTLLPLISLFLRSPSLLFSFLLFRLMGPIHLLNIYFHHRITNTRYFLCKF